MRHKFLKREHNVQLVFDQVNIYVGISFREWNPICAGIALFVYICIVVIDLIFKRMLGSF
jgi:hypothetical protein